MNHGIEYYLLYCGGIIIIDKISNDNLLNIHFYIFYIFKFFTLFIFHTLDFYDSRTSVHISRVQNEKRNEISVAQKARFTNIYDLFLLYRIFLYRVGGAKQNYFEMIEVLCKTKFHR